MPLNISDGTLRGARVGQLPARLAACYHRDMRKIIIDPDICNGQPVIEGTRITASTVLEFLSAGDSIDDVLAGYPTLTRDDVLACLAYSARLLKHHFEVGAVA